MTQNISIPCHFLLNVLCFGMDCHKDLPGSYKMMPKSGPAMIPLKRKLKFFVFNGCDSEMLSFGLLTRGWGPSTHTLLLLNSSLSYIINADAHTSCFIKRFCEVICHFSFLWKVATMTEEIVSKPTIFPEGKYPYKSTRLNYGLYQ